MNVKLKISVFVFLLFFSLFATYDNTLDAYAQNSENFDFDIINFYWDYRHLEQSLVFSVEIDSKVKPGLVVVHMDVESDEGKTSMKSSFTEIIPGEPRTVHFTYPVEDIHDVSIFTWLTPPVTAADPSFIFDENKFDINSKQIQQKIIDAVEGIPLSINVMPTDSSNYNILLNETLSDPSKIEGIRIVYSDNSEHCNSLILKQKDHDIVNLLAKEFLIKLWI